MSVRKRVGKVRCLALVAVFLAAWSAPAGAADEIVSGNIKEADNRSGQNTNAGSGVKTNHIQNGAVTSAKIKDGGVAAADLANNSVTSAKIKDGSVSAADLADGAVDSGRIQDFGIFGIDLADGAVDSAKIADGGVLWSDLADGAVDGAKIADGAVSSADLAPGAVDAVALGDGSVTAAKLANSVVTPRKIGFYSRVIVVDVNGGGDFTSPVEALNSITDASATNPYLVKLMPGVYNVGSTSVVMRPYVDIEGSGEGMTLITGQNSNSSCDIGVVRGASNAEIRFLTIENVIDGECSVGFYTPPGAAPSLLQVTIQASGASGSKYAVFNAFGSVPSLFRVKAVASGGEGATGIQSNSIAATLTEVTATASGGSQTNFGIINYYNGVITMRRVEATATGVGGGGMSIGVWNYLVSVTMSEVTATASGSSQANIGVLNELAGGYSLTNVVAIGHGALSYGMRNRADAGAPASILVAA
ncbi:MAG TPA: hypothetical protein VN317_10030, partial [Candidatus Methanoperedens sp.]|nr:hypothetical protein [Candidatus Methanoperedens sp.]